ncbi:MAG: MEDS domain-containing protein [Gemmatimonadota bacterium]|nr:MEDS domain-containing protein [Gemmatimonadaceae bacterium]MDQ3516175.1 MEDS domain-containing protein [Gemmatimonadota bacterium]
MGPAAKSHIALGAKDETVDVGDHIAYVWETPAEFIEAVGFLERGVRDGDHCVVFGHDDANAEVLRVLTKMGFDPGQLVRDARLTVLGGRAQGDMMLEEIGAAFQRATEGGAPLIRLLGNIGWSRPGWPEDRDILAFEAKVTGAAKLFPSVVMCMYDAKSLSGNVMLHGCFETHPLVITGNLLRKNPYYVQIEEYLRRI